MEVEAEEARLSRRIADMVLAGWQLLDEFCPVYDAVPLLMDAQGRKFSVAQNAFVEDTGPPPLGPANTDAGGGGGGGGGGGSGYGGASGIDAFAAAWSRRAPSGEQGDGGANGIARSGEGGGGGGGGGAGDGDQGSDHWRRSDHAQPPLAQQHQQHQHRDAPVAAAVPQILLRPLRDADAHLDPTEVLEATQRTLIAKIQAAQEALVVQNSSLITSGSSSNSNGELHQHYQHHHHHQFQTQMIGLIKECSDALLLLRQLQQKQPPSLR
jgi:hypothetical protein